MALTPEDIASIQELINTGLMPQVEKLVDEKLTAGLSGLSSVVEGMLKVKPENGEGAPNSQTAGMLGLLAALAPVLLQVLPMLKGQQQQADPMAQFNSMAAMWKTASDVMLAPVMDVWSRGMSFGVNAVSVAQRVSNPVDAAAFRDLIQQPLPMTAKPSQPDPQVSPPVFDYDAFTRSTSSLGDKGYQ